MCACVCVCVFCVVVVMCVCAYIHMCLHSLCVGGWEGGGCRNIKSDIDCFRSLYIISHSNNCFIPLVLLQSRWEGRGAKTEKNCWRYGRPEHSPRPSPDPRGHWLPISCVCRKPRPGTSATIVDASSRVMWPSKVRYNADMQMDVGLTLSFYPCLLDHHLT